MARPIPAGDYRIVNVKNQSVSLDVSGQDRRNGANVQVWTSNNSDSQIFSVSYNDDDSVRILARFTGKSVDVNGEAIQNGTNVQQWTFNNGRAQRWVLAASGSPVQHGGAYYQPYTIRIQADESFVLDVSGTAAASGSNCILWSDDGGSDQMWLFTPVQPFEDGGVYEIRSMLNARYVADVASQSKADGANVMLYASNAGNNQKFAFTADGGRWAIRNINSGKLLDVSGASATNGANVIQYADNGGGNQRWKVETFGTQPFGGSECQIASIGSYVEASGDTFVMAVQGGNAANSSNIRIWEDGGGAAYRWLLCPTSAEDPTMPIPTGLAMTDGIGSKNLFRYCGHGESPLVTWMCTRSWTQSGPNHYQIRIRTRLMSSESSSWGAWSEWAAWETANCAMEGQRAWLADPLDTSYDTSLYKNMQIECQVRCVGVDGLSSLVGRAATADFEAVFKPTFQFPGAGISPQGLRIAYSSDYTGGMSVLHIDSLSIGGSGIMVGGTLEAGPLDSEGTFVIPAERLGVVIQDGSQISIGYRIGTDQAVTIGTAMTASVTALEDAGSGADATPELAKGPGRTIIATVPHIGEERLWVRLPDGTGFEVDAAVSGGEAVFAIPYPFGTDFTVYTTVVSDDGDDWGVSSTAIPAGHPLADAMPCHAWSWDGGSFILECSADPLITDRTLTLVYEANALDSREFESVSFAPTIKGGYKAVGMLHEHITESGKAQLIALVKARHTLYRAPSGEMSRVAITSVAYRTHREVTIIEIGMIEEAV